MRTCANRDVISHAQHGKDINGYGSVWTRSTPNGIRRGGYQTGHLPPALRRLMSERADSIVQVIYSYGTPIAWLDAGMWVIPNVRYSVTTGKHQGYLWKLHGEPIPFDCPLDEYLRVLNGQMVYTAKGTAPRENVTS